MRCYNCHNQEAWDFDGGKEFTYNTLQSIKEGLINNNIKRKLCIMGGEPLCQENLFLTYLVINEIKLTYPDIPVYVWTGYIFEDLKQQDSVMMRTVLSKIDFLIDGPYIDAERNITLPMRGSENQRIIDLRGIK